MMRLLITLPLLSMLTACAWISDYLGGDENITPPTELTEIKDEINVQRLWHVNIGSGSGKYLLHLVPALTESMVFAADYKGKLHAIRIADGERIWQIDTDLTISAGPGVGEEMVLVGGQNGVVAAYSTQDGKLLWRTEVSSEVLSVPVIAAGVVVVRTIDGRVRALNAITGKRLWIYNRKEPVLTLRGNSSPVIDGNVVHVGFDNGKLVALTLDRGQLLWESAIAVPRGRSELERMVDIDGELMLKDGIAYVTAYQGRVAALTLDAGSLLWTRELSSYAGLGIDRRNVYVTDDSSQVLALDRNTGASLWRQEKLMWRTLKAPAVVDDYVVVADFEGYLHWLSSEDGHFVARVRGDGEGWVSAPGVVGNTLIAQGSGGGLYAFRVQN
jgi:outer membrane protein assembly factor BamB